MKSLKSFLILSVLLCCLVGCTSNKSAQNDFRGRLSELHDKINVVADALDQAEGFPEKAGLIDLQVAKFFAEYIAWELDHPELMKDSLLSCEIFRKNVKVDPSEHQRRYSLHIDRELTGSMKILDQALIRLESDSKWPKLKDIQWNKVEYQNGYFRFDGRPVFFGGFNMLARNMVDAAEHPEWAEKDKDMTRSFLLKMQKIGAGILGSGANIPGLVMEDGSVNRSRIQEFAEKIEQYGQMAFKVDILLSWKGEQETLEKLWPGITEYYGNCVYLDIDHPGARVMVSRVMAELIPAVRDLRTIASWDLANEPFFNMDMWSGHTLQKYHAWLADQYMTIEKLNAVWKTSYGDFEEIPLPKEKTTEQCSAGQWYDRVTFHNYRVTSFFEFVQSEIRKIIPDTVIHLKAQDNSSLGPLLGAVTDGIDREMLTPLASLQGVDTRPLPVTEPRMAAGNRGDNSKAVLNYDGSLYGFHWLGQSFLYDYLTSLKPYRPIVDFEYHAFSINPIRIPDIRQSHPQAALWMAHLHGLIGNMSWYWHRRYGPDPFPGKYFKTWLYSSISTQPLIAAEYFHTMLKLNAFSEEVETLATVSERPVRIFVSKPSYIQNRAHIDALHRVYEGVCFHGLRVGFVTEDMLADSSVPRDCKLVIIPDAEYVSAAALQVLKRAKKTGVQLVRFGKRKTAYDAHGLAHSPESIAFLRDAPVFDYAAAPILSQKLEKLLSPMTAGLSIRVTSLDGHNAFGVMHRQTKVNGKQILLLVNVSGKPVQVQLHSKQGHAIDGFDMLNSEAVQGVGLTIPFQGVRLISIEL